MAALVTELLILTSDWFYKTTNQRNRFLLFNKMVKLFTKYSQKNEHINIL